MAIRGKMWGNRHCARNWGRVVLERSGGLIFLDTIVGSRSDKREPALLEAKEQALRGTPLTVVHPPPPFGELSGATRGDLNRRLPV